MKKKIISVLILVIIFYGFRFPDDPKRFEKKADDDISKFTNIGNIGLTVSNFGIFGHGFTKKNIQPSCEYPLGSGIEHLFAAGLWVGGIVKGQKRVTTGAVDAPSISTSGGGFEFTNSPGNFVKTRSSIVTSPVYSPDAVSHQDFIADYVDTNLKTSGGQPISNHIPLGLAVHQETYAWNYSFANYFVILNFYLTNVGTDSITLPYVGIWADAVVRNIKVSQETGTAFYSHGANGYIDSLRMAYQFDYDGDVGATDSYIGLKILGSEPRVDSAYFQVWQYRNTSGLDYLMPQDDIERYDRMSVGLTKEKIDPLRTKPSNRMTLISGGPYKTLKPGDTLNVTFAIICAKKYGTELAKFDTPDQRKNLVTNTLWAQRAYNGNDRNGNGIVEPDEDDYKDKKIHRYILPAPPAAPFVKFVPEDRKVTLYWDKSSQYSKDPISNKFDFEGYKIYRTNAGVDLDISKDIKSTLVLAAEFDSLNNNVGLNTGFQNVELKQPVTFANDTVKYYYKFEFDNLLNGWQYAFSVTAFDKGDVDNNLEILEVSPLVNARQVFPGTTAQETLSKEIGVYPNPYYGGAIWDGSGERQRKIYFYNLPTSCEILIYTLAGDIVAKISHESNSVGTNIGWFQTFSSSSNQVFTGGEHAWDLISERDQAIATGLYLFTVKDNKSGEIKRGKFLIIK